MEYRSDRNIVRYGATKDAKWLVHKLLQVDGVNHDLEDTRSIVSSKVNLAHNVGLTRKQKIGVKKCWVREGEIGEECRRFSGVNFGRECFGETGKTRPNNLQKKNAIKIR